MKLVRTAGLVCLLLLFCLYTYAFKIEPSLLQVVHLEAGEGSRHIRIVQFSDTHIKESFRGSALKKIAKAINEAEPDLIVFTGDLYDNYDHFSCDEEVIAFLDSLQAPYKFAIYGNRDIGGEAVTAYEDIMEAGGFQVLVNDSEKIDVNGAKLTVSGLDDGLMGLPERPEGLEEGPSVLLLHEPDLAVRFGQDSELVLAGHSHAGQIGLPGIDRLLAESQGLAQTYWDGEYELDNGLLYVNSGIGTTHIEARLGVVPEIAVIDLYLKDQ